MSTELWDEEAEQAVLGACLLSSSAALAALDILRPEDFYRESHQHIFGAIVQVVLESGETDPITVGAALGGKLKLCGGTSYLHALASTCPSAMRVREYAAQVRSWSIERQIEKVIESTRLNGHRGSKRLDALMGQLFSIESPAKVDLGLHEALSGLLEETTEGSEAACGYPWHAIELWSRGLRPGHLTYLAGGTSHGKTAAALQIAEHNARKGKIVLFNSLEMSAREIALRAAMRHGIEVEKLWFGRSGEAEREALEIVSKDPIWQQIRLVRAETVAGLAQAIRRYRPHLVIVDYLGLIINQRAESRRVAFTEASAQLKNLAVRTETPILCLAQLSRPSREERNRIPTLDRLKESGDLENDADVVLLVWRKRDETGAFEKEAAMVVAKARNGRTGALRMSFDEKKQEFLALL